MRGGGGPIAAVGASLALLVAVPLIAVHVAGAGRVASPGDRGRRWSSSTPSRRRAMLPDGTGSARSRGCSRETATWRSRRPAGGSRSPAPGAAIGSSTSRLPTGALRRLTWSSRSEDVEPAWSPDGSQVVWASGAEGESRPPPHTASTVRARCGSRAGPPTTASPRGRRTAGGSRSPPTPRAPSTSGRSPRAGGEPELVHDAARGGTLARLAPLGRPPRLHGSRRAAARDVWLAGARRDVAAPHDLGRATTAGPTGRPTAAPSRSSEGAEARSSRGSSGRPAGPRQRSGGCRAEPAR